MGLNTNKHGVAEEKWKRRHQRKLLYKDENWSEVDMSLEFSYIINVLFRRPRIK